MKKKDEKKDLRYGMVGVSLPNILERVDEELLRKRAELLKKKEAEKELLAKAVEEEEAILEKIKDAIKIKKKMEDEYLFLEGKVTSEKREQAEKDVIREGDVRSGKASLKEFMTKGKRDSEILSETIQKSAAELEQGLKVIHNKGVEILELQKSLDDIRNRARGPILRGGFDMIEFLKNLRSFTEEQVGGYQAEMEGFRSTSEGTKIKLDLIKKGVSLGSGHVWERMTLAEASRIQFDPILPLDLVPQLKSELEIYKDAEAVVVSYFWRSHEIDVTPYSLTVRQAPKPITTSTVEVKSGKFKRDKK